jgi:hypothetical protein
VLLVALAYVQLLLDHKFFMQVAVGLRDIKRLHLAVLVAVVEGDGIPMDKRLTQQEQLTQEVAEGAGMLIQAVMAALESSLFAILNLYYHPLPQQEALR